MILPVWIYACIGVAALCGAPCEAFSSGSPLSVGVISDSFRTTQVVTLHGKSGDDDSDTAWIKEAMGSEDGGDGNGALPPSNGSPDFTQNEIHDMEQLIVSLSKVSDDSKRRERLAEIFDKELDASKDESEQDSGGTAIDSEIPRFAKLFQQSLDNVGENVQAAARELVMEQNEKVIEEGREGEKRSKSPEELQLWALIDIMVQSKTRVKLHMGSLGSKGEFR